jgi:hypothetical protein
MRNRKSLGITVFLAGAMLLLLTPAFAKDQRQIHIAHVMLLGDATLFPGDYTLTWDSHSPQVTVKLMQNHKLAATAQGTMTSGSRKFDRNEVIFSTSNDGKNSLSEIRLKGTTDSIVFNN